MVMREPAPVPGVGKAIRLAAVDLYYQSIRLVPANAAWGLAFVGIVFVAVSGLLPFGLILLPLLAVPLVGIARLAAQIVRGHEVVLSDAWWAWRRFGPLAVAVGAVITLVVLALVSNVVVGFQLGGVAGGALVSLAGWGLIVVWLTALPFWLLLVDSARDSWSVRQHLTLVGLLLLADPIRLIVLGLMLALILGLSLLLVAALLTIGLAYAALVTAYAILPAADRLTIALESRLPPLVIEPPGDTDEQPTG